MISHFPSCTGDSPVPQPGTFTPESAPGMPSKNDGGDFLNVIFRVINPAGAAPPLPRSLPRNGAVSPSNHLVQGKSPSPVSSDDGSKLPAETHCQAEVIAASLLQPKAARPSSEHSVAVSPAKAGNSSQDETDAATTTGIAALLLQPTVPAPILAIPMTPVAMPGVTAATLTGTNSISVVTVAARESDQAGPKAEASVPQAVAPVPLVPASEKTASPLRSVEPTSNAPRSPASPALDLPAKAPPSPQMIPNSSEQISSAQPNADHHQGPAMVASSQPIDVQNETTQLTAQTPETDFNGIGAALSDQRMKFAGQMNESAGRTVQKLPRTPGTRDGQTVLDAVNGAKPVSNGFSRKEEITILPPSIPSSAETTFGNLRADGNTLLETSNDAGQLANRVERVAHLVAQEAAMVRQSGSMSLAVSLKVDPHTELFVQLTSHDGQIQASLRCERGSLAGLDGHWGQLQDSLARQNVQLLPLQDKNFSRPSFAGSNADAGESRDFGKSSQNQQPPARDGLAELLPAETVGAPARSRRSGSRNAGRQGWETWA